MAKFRIDWFRAETLGDFGELRRYYERIEAQLEEASRLELFAIESKPKPKDWETYQQTIQIELDAHEHEFSKSLPRILTYSLISSLHTVVEYRLRGICQELKKRNDHPVSVTKFQGSIVDKVGLFFKAFQYPPLKGDEIQKLRDFIIVRNCIIHNTGFIEGSKGEKRLRELSKKSSNDVTLDWEKRIFVTPPYFIEHLDFFTDMFQRLFMTLNFGPESFELIDEN